MRKALLIAVMFCSVAANAADKEFKQVVRAIETHYNVRHQGIPWIARAFMKVMPGVRGMGVQLAIFEGLPASARTPESIDTFLGSVGPEWTRFVQVWSRKGEHVCIYARPDGKHMKMLIVAVDRNEAVVLRVRVRPEDLAKDLEHNTIRFARSTHQGSKRRTEEPVLKARPQEPEQQASAVASIGL